METLKPSLLPWLPCPGRLGGLTRLAVSEAVDLVSCSLRVLYGRDLALREAIPVTPARILGSASHQTLSSLEHARRLGHRASSPTDGTREVSARCFDSWLDLLCQRQALRLRNHAKQPPDAVGPGRSLPYYAIQKARLMRHAGDAFGVCWEYREPEVNDCRGDTQGERHRSQIRSGVPTLGPSREVPLHSKCGRLVGIADSISVDGGIIEIAEMKTGRPSRDQVLAERGRRQLLLYAFLLHEETGIWPLRLVLQSFAGEKTDVSCEPDEIVATANDVFAALEQTQQLLTREHEGIEFKLASPSLRTCTSCQHRPWCAPYWAEGEVRQDGDSADLQGVVEDCDGWVAVLRSDSRSEPVRLNLRLFGHLPPVGTSIRTCDAVVIEPDAARIGHKSTFWMLPCQ